MPKELRDKARLIVLQAWFDDSGKEGKAQSPVYLLAGYSAPVSVWASFADAWNEELNCEPKLAYLHTVDAYGFEKEFGKHKDKTESAWLKFWGSRNRKERDARLLRFADLIVEFMKDGGGEAITWMLRHDDYEQMFRMYSANTVASADDLKKIKNPYYLSFQQIFMTMLKLQGFKNTKETIHILFDCGIDRIDFLERAYNDFTEILELEKRLHPESLPYLELLENKKPEFRDDKKNPPLQAADLFAWHLRRCAWEAAQGKRFRNAVWERLNSKEIVHYDFKYTMADWVRILERTRH